MGVVDLKKSWSEWGKKKEGRRQEENVVREAVSKG